MVVDIRYHLASLVAVFLALGLGILIGTSLASDEETALRQEAWLASLERQLERLQERRGETAALLEAAERERNLYARFAQDASAFLIAERLAGRSGAIVLMGKERTALAAAEALLAQAGASVVRLVHLRPGPGAQDGQLLALLSPERPPQGAKAGELLAAAVVQSGPHQMTSVDTPALWLESRSARPADFAVFVVDGADGQAEPLVAEAVRHLKGLDVPVALIAAGSGAAHWRALAAREALPYVEHFDSPLGQVSLILMLAAGEAGVYGVGDDLAPWPQELLERAVRGG